MSKTTYTVAYKTADGHWKQVKDCVMVTVHKHPQTSALAYSVNSEAY